MVGVKCLFKMYYVNPGNIANLLVLIAFTNVVFTGENSAIWRNFTGSAFISFFLMMAPIFGEVA